MKSQLHIAIVGTGNVGWNLALALREKTKHKISLVSKSENNLEFAGQSLDVVSSIEKLEQIDLSISCVPDDWVESTMAEIANHSGFAAHTSGSIPMLAGSKNGGVFYPFQTFTKGRKLNWQNIPICIEANSPDLRSLLFDLGSELSGNILELSSEQRRRLHLVGVFAANFNNHLKYLISRQLNAVGIDPDFAVPLMDETERKWKEMGAYKAQTGPALRHDSSTISSHLKLIESDRELHDLYLAFTKSIQTTHK